MRSFNLGLGFGIGLVGFFTGYFTIFLPSLTFAAGYYAASYNLPHTECEEDAKGAVAKTVKDASEAPAVETSDAVPGHTRVRDRVVYGLSPELMCEYAINENTTTLGFDDCLNAVNAAEGKWETRNLFPCLVHGKDMLCNLFDREPDIHYYSYNHPELEVVHEGHVPWNDGKSEGVVY